MSYTPEIELYADDTEFRETADLLGLPITCDGVLFAESLLLRGAGYQIEEYFQTTHEVLAKSNRGRDVGNSILELLDAGTIYYVSGTDLERESYNKIADRLTNIVLDAISPVQPRTTPGSTTTAA